MRRQLSALLWRVLAPTLEVAREEGREEVRAELDHAEARIQAVRDTLSASDDGTEYDHNGHQPFEGEPECPGCWVEGIRRALEG